MDNAAPSSGPLPPQPQPYPAVTTPFPQALIDAVAALDTLPAAAQRLFPGRGGTFPGC